MPLMEFFLIEFFSDKNICHYCQRARTCHLLCARTGGLPQRQKDTHVETGSLNSAQFMPEYFIRFPEFAEFTEFKERSASFRKNSNVLVRSTWIV